MAHIVHCMLTTNIFCYIHLIVSLSANAYEPFTKMVIDEQNRAKIVKVSNNTISQIFILMTTLT